MKMTGIPSGRISRQLLDWVGHGQFKDWVEIGGFVVVQL
tara:strand:- start:4055 stop:4171 length:117 start_codon:yes stop_codon:yes gene_type:complete